MARGCMVVRVFTRGEEGGNHLGVVNDVTGLDDHLMQNIAADLGFSETVFVEWQPGAAPFVRIFTPSDELPFAGHPLVGTAWVMMMLSPGDMHTLRYRLGEAAMSHDGENTWVEVPLSGRVEDAGDAAAFLDRAGITGFEDVMKAMMPLEDVVARLPTAAAVAGVEPEMAVLTERFGTYIYARDGDRVRARFFAPDTGVPEDPATGSAAVALAALLDDAGEREGRLTILQGEEMGHPSQIQLKWGHGTVAIGGTVRRDEMRMLDD